MHKIHKAIAIFLCILLSCQQIGFAQVANVELNIAAHLKSLHSSIFIEKFRPLHLRYLQFDSNKENFQLLIDKGSLNNPSNKEIENASKDLLKYFFIGLSLPSDNFWVNLRPDSPNEIINPLLAKTDIGRILLEADVQLKKDTAKATSPETLEGKYYWDKLYQKAEEIYGSSNVTIPTLTRPWIVPDEIIISESKDSAYVYKATLKVMLEQDYLKAGSTYSFKDSKEKLLNEYSSQIIREKIIPKLTKDINSSKRYAPLRQVYYSLILAQWFKARNKDSQYSRIIDKKDISNFKSNVPYSVNTYFDAYKENFAKGEYNIKAPIYSTHGQVIRSYFSGGITGIAPAVMPASVGALAVTDPNTGARITLVPTQLNTPQSNSNVGVLIQANDQGNIIRVITESLTNQTFSNRDLRVKAEQVLGRIITDEEFDAIQRAHNIGPGHFLGRENSDGTFEKNENPDLAFTSQEIAQKVRILAAAGFTQV